VTPLLLTQDVDVPVVAVAVTRETWPRLAFGLSAHLDATRAARDALEEALQNWVELRAMGEAEAADADGTIGRYARSPGDAAAFANPADVIPAASVGPETVPTGEAHLEAVVERVTDAGLSAYGARTTTRDVAAVGFEAVRVLVPAAQPLFFDDPYFGERAATVPEALGFEPRLDRAHHPFP
jgi:ribosomal protein S12 methylthiotransferase accessory factor